mmetsp:Transcript_80783/g.233609  ORF Transcript_80783/g.233609 Transcript_80783/m.233609 type:complete len:246 (+) Transcript_80783:347-1084(+)
MKRCQYGGRGWPPSAAGGTAFAGRVLPLTPTATPMLPPSPLSPSPPATPTSAAGAAAAATLSPAAGSPSLPLRCTRPWSPAGSPTGGTLGRSTVLRRRWSAANCSSKVASCVAFRRAHSMRGSKKPPMKRNDTKKYTMYQPRRTSRSTKTSNTLIKIPRRRRWHRICSTKSGLGGACCAAAGWSPATTPSAGGASALTAGTVGGVRRKPSDPTAVLALPFGSKMRMCGWWSNVEVRGPRNSCSRR